MNALRMVLGALLGTWLVAGDPVPALAQELTSPRLRQLQHEVGSGMAGAVDTFWAEILQNGSPLVERIGDDTAMRLVTFLWRDPGDTRNVVVYSGHTNTLYEFTREHLARHSMRRLDRTSVWYRSYVLRSDARFTYYVSPNDDLTPSLEVTDWNVRTAKWRNDPLNPRTYRRPHEDRDWIASLLELPAASPQPWIQRRIGVPEGRLDERRFRSPLLGNERRIWIYTPASFRNGGRRAHLLLLFDGWSAVHRQPTLAILDNLHALAAIEPVVAVMIDPLDRKAELGCSQRFSDALARELLPWIRERYPITSDPGRTIVSGGSRGGLAAACAALFHPEAFGNVFSQAGQLTWKAGESELDEENARTDDEYGWIMRAYANRPTLPVRFFLSVGRLDRRGDYPLLLANRHLRDVLAAKGYAVDYSEFTGGHEEIHASLPDFLLSYFRRDFKQ